MNRGKNGRFIKNPNIKFDLPTPYGIFKFSLLLVIFLPWIYLTVFKFDIFSALEKTFDLLFGPTQCSCPSQKTPY